MSIAGYLGDYRQSQTVRFTWNSASASGQSITRSTNGTIQVYKDGNTTQFTTGVTDNEDYDTLTGVHETVIDTSSGYGIGDYYVVLAAGTIDTQTENVGLAEFSIENRFTGEIRAGSTATHSISTITMAAEAAPGVDFFKGGIIQITSGTGAGQLRSISASTNANPPVLTLSRNLVVTPSGTITYKIWAGEQGTTVAEMLSGGIASQASVDALDTYKKNTAVTGFEFGMVDATTGLGAVGKTVSVVVNLDGSVPAAPAGVVAEVGNGLYKVSLTAGEMNGDEIGFVATATGCLATILKLRTQS